MDSNEFDFSLAIGCSSNSEFDSPIGDRIIYESRARIASSMNLELLRSPI